MYSIYYLYIYIMLLFELYIYYILLYLWQQGLPALHQFTDYINSLYPTIKFELGFSEHALHVLGLTLYLIDGFIKTDIYSKPTDSHLYLPPSSSHPKHVFQAIPFGVTTRLKRNCSEEIFLAERTAEYRGYLVNRAIPVNYFLINSPKPLPFLEMIYLGLVERKQRNYFHL